MTFNSMMITVLIFCSAFTPAMGEKELSREAQLLSNLLARLTEDSDNRILQQRYLNHFPKTKEDFARLFDADDFSELYDGYQYVQHLRKLTASHPVQVGCILMNISKEAVWKADAFNYLQKTAADFILNDTVIFVEILKTYEDRDQEQIIAFFADGIHGPARGYPEIIEKLQKMGQETLATKFKEIESKAARTRDH